MQLHGSISRNEGFEAYVRVGRKLCIFFVITLMGLVFLSCKQQAWEMLAADVCMTEANVPAGCQGSKHVRGCLLRGLCSGAGCLPHFAGKGQQPGFLLHSMMCHSKSATAGFTARSAAARFLSRRV